MTAQQLPPHLLAVSTLSCRKDGTRIDIEPQAQVPATIVDFKEAAIHSTPLQRSVSTELSSCASESIPGKLGEENSTPHLYLHSEFSIPNTQKAAMTATVGEDLNIQLCKIKVKIPKENEVVVRIAWTGMCRSDACFSVGPEPGFPSHSHIAGHEGIGHVVASYDPCLLGRPVATRYIGYTCQTCRFCLGGLPESCPSHTAFPKHHQGTFQQYMTAPWSSLVPLPRWVFDTKSGVWPGAYTAALCSGSTALKAVQTTDIHAGDVVVVVGVLGGIGHLVGQIAKRVFGAKVIGVDIEEKVTTAIGEKYGHCYDRLLASPYLADAPSWEAFVQNLHDVCKDLRGNKFDHNRADSVIVTASRYEAFHGLDSYVRDGGSITCVGCPRGNGMFTIPLVSALIERQLKVQGCMMGGVQGAYAVMDYIRSGLIEVMTQEIPLEDVTDRMGQFLDCKNSGKLVVRVNGSLPT
ncbi:hypothetical protein PFICI_04309 [Pestalotiopsis fici W106-1]|uniref:Enoyl reductase (ER) domain-containing protein n=1 Tax=Pestalotiopsis fici (strain W106-1 / CGMCC3.15140) TaxID=1229662 RepID=W3X8I8_PESFW|nr:uncharacterized protein PFICI_04309 [Pestalotiopsis fici W106-1]ETS82433.1 hypothetical protein PFICI_04309 [Pestalotiopsis fici W106-1]